ncbi:quinone oxidoreductase-like protein 2 homolog isoform X2 [Parasteatoda tepidariorum]|uniref:quinone oxidoreductase-like protein 2 homolog isoform X2 n=1 Tax=Parasteatoda tepidariorum TaxID=114398 RepID=UPI001C729B84|nr:quinone oxidoreductase-like protein 2 homolog [Parasteatoda tepidariorum]
MRTFSKILNRILNESFIPSLSPSSRSFSFHLIAAQNQYKNSKLLMKHLKTSNLNMDCMRLVHNFKAALLKEFGDELVIKDLPSISKLNESEVRIKVLRCAVNVADTLICSGKYDQEPKLPFIPGYEFSGEILEIGSKVKNLYVGDKVIGLNKDNYSAMATECISQERDLWKIPQDVSIDSAAALVDSYATVLIAARRANLKEHDTVLVTVAAGGLGLAAVDLAANLFNAKVIGACDTEDKANILREKGAFSTVNYSKKELVKRVMKETNNEGVKIIFDAVGGEIFEDCLQCISPEGSIVVLGFSSRKIPQILTSQLLPKSCALIGVSLTHYQRMINETYRNAVQEVINMYLEEFIDPHVAEHFKLKDVNDALKHVEDGKSAGKVILDMS